MLPTTTTLAGALLSVLVVVVVFSAACANGVLMMARAVSRLSVSCERDIVNISDINGRTDGLS